MEAWSVPSYIRKTHKWEDPKVQIRMDLDLMAGIIKLNDDTFALIDIEDIMECAKVKWRVERGRTIVVTKAKTTNESSVTITLGQYIYSIRKIIVPWTHTVHRKDQNTDYKDYRFDNLELRCTQNES